MTHSTQKADAPDLLLLGTDEAGKPRAARFPATQAPLVSKAANLMGLTMCEVDAALAELSKKLPTGRLYANGRGFVPNVKRELFAKVLAAAGLENPSAAVAGQPAPGLPSNWDDIQVGHLVIAQDSAIEGWWEAVVTDKDGDMLTLKWRDYPKVSTFARHTAAVALLRPSPVRG